jgi:hypothetical protein
MIEDQKKSIEQKAEQETRKRAESNVNRQATQKELEDQLKKQQ